MTREEAIEVIKEFVAYGEHVNAFVYKGSTSIPIEALNMAIEALEQEPMHGKWIDEAEEIKKEINRHEYRCSICNCKANYYVGGYDDWWNVEKPNYCPTCGADMRGDEE